MLSELDKNSHKISEVVHSYLEYISIYSRYIVVQHPPIGSKLYNNCLKFYDTSKSCGVNIKTFMLISMDSYPPYWCMMKFKKNFPPFTVAVSESSRVRALKEFPKVMNNEGDGIEDIYISKLIKLGRGPSELLIKGGLLEGFNSDVTLKIKSKLEAHYAK